MAIQITATEFEQKVLQASTPVLVDFFATWCGPCKVMSPILDEVAQEVQGFAEVYKIDVDQAKELSQRYNVMSVPTLFVFKNGKIDQQFMGITPKQVLVEALR